MEGFCHGEGDARPVGPADPARVCASRPGQGSVVFQDVPAGVDSLFTGSSDLLRGKVSTTEVIPDGDTTDLDSCTNNLMKCIQ